MDIMFTFLYMPILESTVSMVETFYLGLFVVLTEFNLI